MAAMARYTGPLLAFWLIVMSTGAMAKEYNTTMSFTIPNRVNPGTYRIRVVCRIDDLPPDDTDYRPRFFKMVNGRKVILAHAGEARIAPYTHYTYLVHHNDYFGYRHVEATLTIEQPVAEDTGTIGCDVPYLNMEKTEELLVPDFGDMEFTIDGEPFNSTLYVVPGQKNLITCKVNGTYPLPELRFFLGASNITSQAEFYLERDDDSSDEMKRSGFWVQRYTATLEMEMEFTEMSAMRYLKCMEDISGIDRNAMTHTLVFVDGVEPEDLHNTTLKMVKRYGNSVGNWGYINCEIEDLPHELMPGYGQLDAALFRVVDGEPWPVTRLDQRSIRIMAPPFNRRGYSTYSKSRTAMEYGDYVGSKLTRQFNLGSVTIDQIGTYMCSLVNVSGRLPVILMNSSYFFYTTEAPPKVLSVMLNGKEVETNHVNRYRRRGVLELDSGKPMEIVFTGSEAYLSQFEVTLGPGINVTDRFELKAEISSKNSTIYAGVTFPVMEFTLTPKKEILVKPSFDNQDLILSFQGNHYAVLTMDVKGMETEKTRGMVWVEESSIHVYRDNPVTISCHVAPTQLVYNYMPYPVSIKWVKVDGTQEVLIGVNGASNLAANDYPHYKPFVDFKRTPEDQYRGSYSWDIPVFKLLIEGVQPDDTAIYKCIAPQLGAEDSTFVTVFGASSKEPLIMGAPSSSEALYLADLNQTISLTFYRRNIHNLQDAKVFKVNETGRTEISFAEDRNILIVNQRGEQSTLLIEDAVLEDAGEYILSIGGVESNPVLVTVKSTILVQGNEEKLYMKVIYHGGDTVAWEDDPSSGFSVACWHNYMVPGVFMLWQKSVGQLYPWLAYDDQMIPTAEDLDRYKITYELESVFKDRNNNFYSNVGSAMDLVMNVKDARIEDSSEIVCSVPGTDLTDYVEVQVARAPETVSMIARYDEQEVELKDGQVFEVMADSSVYLECSAAGLYPEYLPRVIIHGTDKSDTFEKRMSETVDAPPSKYLSRRLLYSASLDSSLKFDKSLNNKLITCDGSVPNTRRRTNSTVNVWVRVIGADPAAEIKMNAINPARVSKGRNITLQCKVTGLPYQVPIQWRKETGNEKPSLIVASGNVTEMYKSSGRYNLTSEIESSNSITYYLTVTDLRDSDYGQIICEIPGLSTNAAASLRPKKPQAQTYTKAGGSHPTASIVLLLCTLLSTLCK